MISQHRLSALFTYGNLRCPFLFFSPKSNCELNVLPLICDLMCVCVFTVRIVGGKGKDVYNILIGHGVRRNCKPFFVMLLLFSCTVVPHCLCHPGLKHARPPCPSLSPGVFSNLCPLSWLCHSTISSSITPFSSCHESFPASESLPMSRIFNSGGKSFGASASASVLPINIQGWLPLELSGLISLLSKWLSRVISSTTIPKHRFFSTQPFYGTIFTSVHDYWENHSFGYMDLCWQSDISAFNTLSRFVKAFLSKSKHLLTSWLQSLSAVILEHKEIKICNCFYFFTIYLPWSDGTRCHDLSFLNVES